MQGFRFWQPLRNTWIFQANVRAIVKYSNPFRHLGHVQGRKIACVIGFCCYLFSRLDISPTAGDFLLDPMVTNEDKYWTQMAEMLQFKHNLTHPHPLFWIPWLPGRRYLPGRSRIGGSRINQSQKRFSRVNTANCSQVSFPNVRYSSASRRSPRVFEV